MQTNATAPDSKNSKAEKGHVNVHPDAFLNQHFVIFHPGLVI